MTRGQASPAGLSVAARGYIATVVVVAVAVLGWLGTRPLMLEPLGVFLLLAGLAFGLESRRLSFAHKGAPVDFSLGTPFVVATLAVFGVLPATLVQLVAAVIADLVSRKPRIKLVLNVALSVVVIAVAGLVLEALLGQRVSYPGAGSGLGDLAAVVVAGAVLVVANNGLTGIMVWLASGSSLRSVADQIVSQEALIEASSLLLVPVIVVTVREQPAAIVLLLVPLAALYRALRIAMDNVTLANERTRALEQVQATEQRFRSMVQYSSDLICLVDPDGQVLYASPAFARTARFPPADDGTWSLVEHIHDEDESIVRRALAHAPESEPVALPDVRLLDADGGVRWIEVLVSDMPTSAPPRRLVLNIRDITDRRRLEAQVRQSQRTEAMGRLAGSIAHDFNNLLQAIGGFTQLARDIGPGNDAYTQDLDEVLKAADRGAELVRKLMAFSRNETAKPALVDVNAAIEDLATLLRLSLGSGVSVHLNPAPCRLTVMIEPGALEQVLVNLAVNAGAAMAGSGVFEIATSHLEGDPGPPVPGWVRIRVSDTGVGMDEATLNRVFEPFYTTKPKEGGTGLGLATTQAIVQAADGRIKVASTPGQGTTFTIDFPAAHDRDTTSPDRSDPHRPD